MNTEPDSWHWDILQGVETPDRIASMRKGSPVTFYPESVTKLMDAVRESILGNIAGKPVITASVPAGPSAPQDHFVESFVSEKSYLFDIETRGLASEPISSVAYKIVDNDPVILYVLMRNDLKSMTAGRAAAHAAHAANQLVYMAREIGEGTHDIDYEKMLQEWEAGGEGFGTTIVLAADMATIQDKIEQALAMDSALVGAGIVNDPTYPLRDGDTTHFISLDTCAYIFGRLAVVKPLLADLPLL